MDEFLTSKEGYRMKHMDKIRPKDIVPSGKSGYIRKIGWIS